MQETQNIIITYWSARSVITGEISLGMMLAIQFILGQLNGPVEQLMHFITIAQDAKISLERIEEVNGEQRKKTVRRKRTHSITVLPRQVHLDGGLNVEKRAYGLHETAVFEMQGAVTGSFETPSIAALPTLGQNAQLTWGAPVSGHGGELCRP